MTGTMPTLKVALLGCGVVGSQVARLLTEQADDLALRIGARLELVGIAVRRVSHPRAAGIDRALLTVDAHALVTRPDVDIVVEVIGGIEPARSLLLAALKNGKPVVTANKALLAEDGAEIYGAAREFGADLYYEASVAGAIPLLRPLRESLSGDTVHRVLGIVNGTTNYILDRMDSSGAGFAESLEEAQALGYAEADPTADIEGFDAAATAASGCERGIIAGCTRTEMPPCPFPAHRSQMASSFTTRPRARALRISAAVTSVMPSRCTSAAVTGVWKARLARIAALAAASNPSTSAVGSASA